MKTLNTLFVTLSLVLLFGCSAESDGPLGQAGDPGGDSGSDPFDFDSCRDMCDVAPTTTTNEADCVANELQGRGYNLALAPLECAAVSSTVEGCNACM
ncbi:MAG: hypothetical protein KJO07_16135, partial [Deltaproteobacteria bacterium]|nr:hypothetical protein [Deltaproteobacteria bacterium]